MEMPRGATAVDFAYAVHTDVGNRCVACRINNRLAPLSEPLESGKTVEIITSPTGRPSPAWFNYVVTARARSHIRNFLKDQRHEDSVELGRNIVDKALLAFNTRLSGTSEEDINTALSRLNKTSLEHLFIDVAVGNLLPHIAASFLAGASGESFSNDPKEAVAIRGTEGFVVTYAKCCCPLPGDPIGGYLSPEKGLVVHRDSCRNLADMRDQPERLMNLRWDEAVEGVFPVGLRVEAENRRGMIALLATRLNAIGINIERISTQNRDVVFTYIDMELKVSSRIHLARIMKRLRTIDGVRKVSRAARR
jgi:(p)ppGpp synthase/HD superfamily hydrolase